MGRDYTHLFFTVLVVIVIAFIGWVIYLTHEYTEDCHRRGGHIVGTGRYTTTYINSGGTLIPVISEVTACDR